ncbi:MAG: O-antigen ligase family protein [Ignavibacteria bacterium]|nr:O-antigen ligase family protein [Ignavibacteria bacterium]
MRYLRYFVGGVTVSCILILFEIIITGKLRAVGLVGFPIMDFLVVSFIIIVFYYFIFNNSYSILLWSVLLVNTCVLITTQSRFAWFGLVISIIYGLIISVKKDPNTLKLIKSKLSWAMLGGVFLVAALIILGLDKIFIARFSDLSLDLFQGTSEGDLVSNSLESRILIWIVAYNVFIDNLWTGVGYLMFSEITSNYNIYPDFIFENFVEKLDAHTTYFNILAETGIVGFTAFISYFITIFIYSYKAINISYNRFSKKISIILNILVFFILIHSIYSGAFTFGTNAYLMHFIFGVTIFNYVFLKKKSKKYKFVNKFQQKLIN